MKGHVVVIHKKDPTPGGYSRIYIGRPSPLGNPFTHLEGTTLAARHVSTRDEAVDAYREWAQDELADRNSAFARAFAGLQRRVAGGENLALECWCAPRRCHGDVLSELLRTD